METSHSPVLIQHLWNIYTNIYAVNMGRENENKKLWYGVDIVWRKLNLMFNYITKISTKISSFSTLCVYVIWVE